MRLKEGEGGSSEGSRASKALKPGQEGSWGGGDGDRVTVEGEEVPRPRHTWEQKWWRLKQRGRCRTAHCGLWSILALVKWGNSASLVRKKGKRFYLGEESPQERVCLLQLRGLAETELSGPQAVGLLLGLFRWKQKLWAAQRDTKLWAGIWA